MEGQPPVELVEHQAVAAGSPLAYGYRSSWTGEASRMDRRRVSCLGFGG
jgi:hypothetical protein